MHHAWYCGGGGNSNPRRPSTACFCFACARRHLRPDGDNRRGTAAVPLDACDVARKTGKHGITICAPQHRAFCPPTQTLEGKAGHPCIQPRVHLQGKDAKE